MSELKGFKLVTTLVLEFKTIQTYKKSLGQGLVWITDSVIDHNINISKYNALAGSSDIKLPEELDDPRKGLINIQNIDYNEASNGVSSANYTLQIVTQ